MSATPMVSAGAPAGDIDTDSALLRIISDPERARRHLGELTAARNAALEATKVAQEETAKANEAKAEARNVRAGADAGVKELKRRVDAFNVDHAVREAALEDRHRVLLAKDKRLTDFEARVAARESTLAAREKAAASREAELGKREAAVRATEADVTERKTALESQIARIKKAVQ